MQLTNKALVLATAFVVSGLPASADDTVLISANTAGNAGNGPSIAAAVSGDGRYVVFSSEATDLVGLVGTDSPGVRDVFLRDRDPDGNGTFDEGNAVTELISVDSNEAQAKSRTSTGRKAITPDGRYVVFNVSGNDPQLGSGGIFVRDRMLGITVPMAVDPSGTPVGIGGCCVDISDDGRYVAFFHSSADLLPPGEDTNGLVDVLVHNRDVNGDGFDGPDFAVIRVSVSTSGTQGNAAADNPLSMSGDGRHVGFRSPASNLVAGDTNGMVDIFIRDRDTDRDAIFDEAGAVLTYRVSVRSDGGQANGNSGHPMLSDDGRFVVFDSVASNLVDGVSGQNVYMHDRDPDENDLFDEGNGTTTLVSVALCGEAGNGTSNRPAISRDGSLVAFVSSASESGCNCRGVRVS